MLRLKTLPRSHDAHGMIVGFQVARSVQSRCQARRSLPTSRLLVPRAERVSCSVPKHDAETIILCCGVEEIRHGDVHGGRHRIFLGRSIELDSQDTSGAFGNNVGHRAPPAVDSKCQACGTAPLARKPSISSLPKPSCLRISSLCSPSSGARRAGTFAAHAL